jgi:hypothetical protein
MRHRAADAPFEADFNSRPAHFSQLIQLAEFIQALRQFEPQRPTGASLYHRCTKRNTHPQFQRTALAAAFLLR